MEQKHENNRQDPATNKEPTRREIIELAALGATVMTAAGAVKVAQAAQSEAKAASKGISLAMVVDTRRCTGCMSCQVSCKMENDVPFGVFRSWVKIVQKGEYPNIRQHFLPRLCNHCDDPPCVKVCPTQASYRRDEGGLVLIDDKKCIGCKYCMLACPYDARFTNPVKGTADKCSFCDHLVDKGLEPTCVRSCMGRARIFGDLNDPNSKVSQVLRDNAVTVLKAGLGTAPKVFYIGMDKDLEGGLRDNVGGAGYYKTIDGGK